MFLFTFATAACGPQDSDDEASSGEKTETVQQTVTQCQPSPPYNSCYETDWNNLEYWQDTLPDPDWREVTPSSEPDLDYKVEIDALELNAGVIPTYHGQGDYSSWSEYQQALTALLGVDPFTNDVQVEIAGLTMKVDEQDNPVAYGDGPGSTSAFLHDALSDEDGRIHVDSQDVTADLLNPQQVRNYEIEVDGHPLGDPASAFQPESSSSGWSEQTTLTDGPWTANLTFDGSCFPSTSNCAQMKTYRAISDLNHTGHLCSWIFTTSGGVVQRECYSAMNLWFDRTSYFYSVSSEWRTHPAGGKTDAAEYEIFSLRKEQVTDACTRGEALFYGSYLAVDSLIHESCKWNY